MKLNWEVVQKEYKRIQKLNLKDLIEQTILSASGDGCDGDFTPEGKLIYRYFIQMLNKRLIELKIINIPLFQQEKGKND